MIVAELIQKLQDMNPESEVRLAQQPNWPFEYSIGEIVEVDLADDQDEETPKTVVYIAEGTQLNYLPGAVRSELGWGR